MRDVPTFFTLRAGGARLRETLCPAGWPGAPRWAGAARDRSVSSHTLGPPQVPPARNRTPEWGRPHPKENGYRDDGTQESRWPAGPWGDGHPCGTPVLCGLGGGLLPETYSRALPGVKRNPARHAARGRRAHQMCSVEMCPCRMDFSRALALLIASSGSATSMSFLLPFMLSPRIVG